MTPNSDVVNDPRWAVVLARRSADFFFSVSTTGVYCRPSCPSRRAKPEHVAFHATREDAERAGFRPCKRCRPDAPDDRQARRVADLCRIIERADAPPTLAELGAHAGLSAFHVQRVFKQFTGVTPRQYAAAWRAQRMQKELARAGRVTDAIYDAGFGSPARFYESSRLGMTPRQFRAGGQGEELKYASHRCTLGLVLVAATSRGVCAILFGDDVQKLERELAMRFPHARLVKGGRDFSATVKNVVRLVDEPGAALALPLDVRGTAFQQRVWQALRELPAGTTSSYAAIAKRIGAPKSTRAVARACGANPLAVAIPCHRVVGANGALGGYRWGIERKQQLLERERR